MFTEWLVNIALVMDCSFELVFTKLVDGGASGVVFKWKSENRRLTYWNQKKKNWYLYHPYNVDIDSNDAFRSMSTSRR